jgi:hypothetical protein
MANKSYSNLTMKTDNLKQISELLDRKLDPIQKDIKVIKKDLGEARNDVKVLIAYFDKEYVNLRRRVELIEEHLGINQVQ